MSGYRYGTPRRGRAALVASAIVVAAVGGFAIGRWALPAGAGTSSGTPAATSRAGIPSVSGPSRITDGVATGYTHTPPGARAAAANFALAYAGVLEGRVKPAAVDQQALASSASAGARKFVASAASAPAPGAVINVISSDVGSYSATSARATVWVAAGSPTGSTGVSEFNYQSFDVRLGWQNGDWKVTDASVSAGPTPTPRSGRTFVPVNLVGSQQPYVTYLGH